MATNEAATVSPIVVYANRRLSYIDEEIQDQAPCKFDGPEVVEGVSILSGETPATAGQWVQDFEWDRFTVDGWIDFYRGHLVAVNWQAATVDSISGDVITPGRWSVFLRIVQRAMSYSGTDMSGDPIHANLAPGAYYFYNWVDRTNNSEAAIYQYSAIDFTYYPPDGYQCLSTDFSRWTRPVPTLPIIQNTPYTFDTLPAGYQWDNNGDATTGISEGPFYPDGVLQTLASYLAPPYIDVRHIPL